MFAAFAQDGPQGTQPWFTDEGQRAIVRHPLNQRGVSCVEARYTESILQRGIVYGVRGLPFAQWSKGQAFPLLALTWGGLSSSFYKAKDPGPACK